MMSLVAKVNQHLAEAAQITGVAMGGGFAAGDARRYQALRLVLICAATPLMPSYLPTWVPSSSTTAWGQPSLQQAIDVLSADAIFLHLNPHCKRLCSQRVIPTLLTLAQAIGLAQVAA